MMDLVVTMTRYSRLHPVHSIKHVVDKQGGLVLGTNVVENVIVAKDTPVLTVAQDVETGSRVNAIFLNVQVTPTSSASIANVYLAVFKNPGDNLTPPNANAVGVSDNKKWVIHQEMIMCQQESIGSIPRTLFKGVISIPGSYKRFGTKDRLNIVLFAPGCNFNYCIQCIYKEIK